jgi:hypothetical protein
MKISAYLFCVLQALVVGFFVVLYADDPHPLRLGAVVYAALLFFVQLADAIRRGP